MYTQVPFMISWYEMGYFLKMFMKVFRVHPQFTHKSQWFCMWSFFGPSTIYYLGTFFMMFFFLFCLVHRYFFQFYFCVDFFRQMMLSGTELKSLSLKTSNLCPHGYEICKQINYLILFLKIRFENIINVSPSWVWDFFSFLFGNFNYQLLYISQFQQDT